VACFYVKVQGLLFCGYSDVILYMFIVLASSYEKEHEISAMEGMLESVLQHQTLPK
jgi:hypothetical protein